MSASKIFQSKQIALVGNPNTGKTTLFNALTGLRHSTANYPGVTVEKRTGWLELSESCQAVSVLDLPGTYSLLPRSPDEEVVHDVLLGVQEGVTPPDLVAVILDANNLERNLYLATQVLELGIPAILVLNMWDMARENGIEIDIKKLEELMGVRCIPTIGMKKDGIDLLKRAIERELTHLSPPCLASGFESRLSGPIREELSKLLPFVKRHYRECRCGEFGEAIRLLGDTAFRSPLFKNFQWGDSLRSEVLVARAALVKQGIDWSSAEAELRYAYIESVMAAALKRVPKKKLTVSEKLDKVFTHRIWGLAIFVGLMTMTFQSIFTWAEAPMELIAQAMDLLSRFMRSVLPEGPLESLVVEGMIAGVGNVFIFLPQIFLLFFFIALFEDTGYMARAVFVLDRLMKKVGLNGKAFLPLLSSFACAVPGVMASRTIEDRNDRLATILVAPLMSCSARLPVYTLMIAACVPSKSLFGILNLQSVTMISMYVLSLAAGLGIAALFRKTFLKGNRMPFVFELPPYRIPHMKTVFMTMWDRGKEFLVRAGSIIFLLSIVLWFLVNYPKDHSAVKEFETKRAVIEQTMTGETRETQLIELDHDEKNRAILSSYAGQLGKLVEPAIRPLGFNWEIGIGLVASFAAREVIVSTLAIIYHVGAEDEAGDDLVEALQKQRSSTTGKPVYTPLIAISLMVFYVLACQCLSTVAVVKRETGTWVWPFFMVLYMTALAWAGSFVVCQGGKLLGFE